MLFGYIKPFKPEMKIKEFEAFKSVYCGLCHQLGRSFGPLARLTLNYDFVFLAMIAYSQSQAKPVIIKGKCAVNPAKSVPVCLGDETMQFSADCAALMIYHNLLDKIEDGGVFSKIGYTTIRPIAARAKNMAEQRQPQAAQIIAELSRQQKEIEKNFDVKTDGIDLAAQPTAKTLGELFSLLSNDEGRKRVLERLGYLVGRYIYICDALDDLEDDIKSRSFNPLIELFLKDTTTPQNILNAKEYAKSAIWMTVGEMGKTCVLLDMNEFKPMIENIICLGMNAQAQHLSCSGKCKEQKA